MSARLYEFLHANWLALALSVAALLVLTVGRTQVIGKIAQRYDVPGSPLGEKYQVSGRFLEVDTSYDVERFRTFVRSYPQAAQGYASPVLFPLDLLFMVLLAGLVGGISFQFAGYLGLPPVWRWLTLLLPVLYFAFDLAEDSLLAAMLNDPALISGPRVQWVKRLTLAKIVAFSACLAQASIVLVWALARALLKP